MFLVEISISRVGGHWVPVHGSNESGACGTYPRVKPQSSTHFPGHDIWVFNCAGKHAKVVLDHCGLRGRPCFDIHSGLYGFCGVENNNVSDCTTSSKGIKVVFGLRTKCRKEEEHAIMSERNKAMEHAERFDDGRWETSLCVLISHHCVAHYVCLSWSRFLLTELKPSLSAHTQYFNKAPCFARGNIKASGGHA
jgi:hypothetical protein